MRHLKNFCINTVSRKLNEINVKININHSIPLPCIVLLSNYRFKKRYVKISWCPATIEKPCMAGILTDSRKSE